MYILVSLATANDKPPQSVEGSSNLIWPTHTTETRHREKEYWFLCMVTWLTPPHSQYWFYFCILKAGILSLKRFWSQVQHKSGLSIYKSVSHLNVNVLVYISGCACAGVDTTQLHPLYWTSYFLSPISQYIPSPAGGCGSVDASQLHPSHWASYSQSQNSEIFSKPSWWCGCVDATELHPSYCTSYCLSPLSPIFSKSSWGCGGVDATQLHPSYYTSYCQSQISPIFSKSSWGCGGVDATQLHP